MTGDLFDDDDLFAPRPTPTPARVTKPVAPAPTPIPPRERRYVPASAPDAPLPAFLRPYPVASFACPCGALDEVKEPAPDRLDCWKCTGLETARRWSPRPPPPRHAGRELTAEERRGLALDGH